MEPAVSTVLAEVFSLPTAWDDLRDWRFLPGFQVSRKTALWLQAVPIAGGIPGGRRRLVGSTRPPTAFQPIVGER
jgi:hypothetical protein